MRVIQRQTASWARHYGSLLQRHPLATKMATSGAVGLVADLIAQLVLEKDAAFDPPRLAKFVLLQAVLVAPALHLWYATESCCCCCATAAPDRQGPRVGERAGTTC
jgi:hypothetical protein